MQRLDAWTSKLKCMDPRFAIAPQTYQPPSQRSRERGQQEHLSDFFPNNAPLCTDRTFPDVGSAWIYGFGVV